MQLNLDILFINDKFVYCSEHSLGGLSDLISKMVTLKFLYPVLNSHLSARLKYPTAHLTSALIAVIDT